MEQAVKHLNWLYLDANFNYTQVLRWNVLIIMTMQKKYNVLYASYATLSPVQDFKPGESALTLVFNSSKA